MSTAVRTGTLYDDDRQVGKLARYRRVPLEQPLLRRRGCSTGVIDQHGIRAERVRLRGQPQRLLQDARCRCPGRTAPGRRPCARPPPSTASRSSTDCELGSPVEPWTEIPCEPLSELPLDQPRQRAVVDRAVRVERRHDRRDRAADQRRIGAEPHSLSTGLRTAPVSAVAPCATPRTPRAARRRAGRARACSRPSPPARPRTAPRAPARPRRARPPPRAARGSTTTPSASPTITSPGSTSTPPHATGTFVSSG